MKKAIIALAAMLTMGTALCHAQDNNGRPQPPKDFNPQEMIQKRTDETVKKYSLDETQAKKLLALNQKYDTLLMRPMGGPRRGPRPEGRRDTTNRRPELTAEQKAKMEEGRKNWEAQRQKMEEARKAYDTELQTILTTEQYEKYQADSKRRPGGPRKRD